MKKCKHRRVDDLYSCTNIGSGEVHHHGNLPKSSCCDAELIYYGVYEKCFMDRFGNVLITERGIDKIDMLIKVIKNEDFKQTHSNPD